MTSRHNRCADREKFDPYSEVGRNSDILTKTDPLFGTYRAHKKLSQIKSSVNRSSVHEMQMNKKHKT